MESLGVLCILPALALVCTAAMHVIDEVRRVL